MSILVKNMEEKIVEIRIAWEIDQKHLSDLVQERRDLAEGRQALKSDQNNLAQERSDLAQERRDVAEGRRALESDRAAWAAEMVAVEKMSIRPEDRVLLDVGGTHYTTTRETLRAVPGSMLDAMFSGRHEERNHADAEGRVQINRSGSLFSYVLDFLRDRSVGGRKRGCFDLRPAGRSNEDYQERA